MAQAEKRNGKLTGWWYGEVDNRHKGGVRFRRRFETKAKAQAYEAYVRACGEEPPGATEGEVNARTFASVAAECKEAGGPKGAWKRGRDPSVLTRLATLTRMPLGKLQIDKVSYSDLMAVVTDLERRPTRMKGEKMSVGTINRYYGGERGADVRAVFKAMLGYVGVPWATGSGWPGPPVQPVLP